MQLNLIICCRVYLFAEGLQALLEEDDAVRILGIASNEYDIDKLMQYTPDIIVADHSCSKVILKKHPSGKEKKLLLIDDSRDLQGRNLKTMISDGLGGVLPKNADVGLLRKAVRKLHDGELWIDHQTLREVFDSSEEKHPEIHLTRKEQEILSFVCSGHTNKEIARKLFISEQTVKSHCNHLFKKFGVSSRLKLAISAPKFYTEGNLNRLQ